MERNERIKTMLQKDLVTAKARLASAIEHGKNIHAGILTPADIERLEAYVGKEIIEAYETVKIVEKALKKVADKEVTG